MADRARGEVKKGCKTCGHDEILQRGISTKITCTQRLLSQIPLPFP